MHDPNYDDSAEGEATPESAPAEAEDSDATTVVPKSFFGGKSLEPGSECRVKIDRVLDDSVLISYVPHESSEPEEPSEPSAEPETADNMYG